MDETVSVEYAIRLVIVSHLIGIVVGYIARIIYEKSS